MEKTWNAKASEFENENLALKNQLKSLENIAATFNKKLTEARTRLEKEKAASEKEFKQEIKDWKRELGYERKLKINLEKKLCRVTSQLNKKSSNLSPTSPAFSSPSAFNDSPASVTSCNMCAETISNYIPRFFLGNEINPTCKNCYENSDDDDNQESESKRDVSSVKPIEDESVHPIKPALTYSDKKLTSVETMVSKGSTSLSQNSKLYISTTPSASIPHSPQELSPGFPPGFPPPSRTSTPGRPAGFPPQWKPPS